MSEGVAFINGEYVDASEAKISVFDQGFAKSDVVYDVVSTWKGLFFRLDDHVERFLHSCDGIRVECPYGADQIKRILAECTHRAGLEDAYVEVTLTRGMLPEDGSRDIRLSTPTFFAYAVPYVWIVRPEQQEKGISLTVAETRRIPDEAVDMRFKNFHWADLTRAKLEAYDRGCDNAILCTPSGVLSEGPGFNIFFQTDGILRTPRTNVLEGITRLTVFGLAEEAGVETETGEYAAETLLEADEAFICSTAGGIMPVVRVDDRILSNGAPGPLSAQIRERYWSKREEGWLGTPVTDLIGEQAVA